MTTYISIAIAIVAFSLIVIAHEAGHFVAAKKSGVCVLEFAIGMGPKLLSKTIGETVYSIRAFPIGGFCKMLGEDEDCNDPRAFGNKKPLAKFIVLVAGAVMNFILGLLLIFILILATGYSSTVISEVSEERPAYQAGIRQGDKIISIDGRKTYSFEDILFAMNFINEGSVEVKTLSNGEVKTYNIKPVTLKSEYGSKTYERYIIGVSPETYAGMLASDTHGYPRASISDSAANSFYQLRFYVNATFESLYMLVTGKLSLGDLSGFIGIGGAFVEGIEEPISTTVVDGREVPFSIRFETAFINVLTIMILITINLGIMNLMPLPALDGGRAIFVIIEGIRHKPIDQDKEGMIHFAGFVLLMLLMVFVTFNDIFKLFNNG